MRVYISGPMTGIEDFNFPAFHKEAENLRAKGLDVVNPAELGVIKGWEWADYMRKDISELVTCDGIHMLRGWNRSRGAKLEMDIATELGMTVTYADE